MRKIQISILAIRLLSESPQILDILEMKLLDHRPFQLILDIRFHLLDCILDFGLVLLFQLALHLEFLVFQARPQLKVLFVPLELNR
jgi:hypothetical protein